MPRLKPDHISPTDDEDAAIMAAIAADPDTFELDAEWFATAKSFREVYPNGIDRPPRPPAELWPERFAAEPENEAWDEAKRRENMAKHAIDFAAIRNFEWATAVYNASPRHGELRWVVTGYIGIRLHTVVYTQRGDRRRIISLRIAGNKARRDYAEA